MIIVKLMGGLGNQMFQYAFGRSLALKTKSELKFDLTFLLNRQPMKNFTFRDYALDVFNIAQNIATSEDIAPFKMNGGILKQLGIITRLHAQNKFYIKEQLISLYRNYSGLKGDFYLDGFWQNEKYFKSVEDNLRNDFTFRSSINPQIEEIINTLKNTNSVSISIRRGDYLKWKKSDQIYYICDADYYLKAMDKIANLTSRPFFFVFSDDFEWCEKNLTKKYPIRIIGREYAGERFQDYLRLITLCKHHIIANSTFSWWGAWLNPSKEKITISPRHWFHPKRLLLNYNSIIPNDWIKI